MTAKSLALLAAILMVLVRCSGTLSPEECYRARPVISVSGGTTPVFSWSPSCPIAELTVTGAWYVYTIESFSNGIGPPVLYNSVPAGARQGCPCPPAILQMGTQYLVSLTRWERLSDGGSALLAWGASTSFVP